MNNHGYASSPETRKNSQFAAVQKII